MYIRKPVGWAPPTCSAQGRGRPRWAVPTLRVNGGKVLERYAVDGTVPGGQGTLPERARFIPGRRLLRVVRGRRGGGRPRARPGHDKPGQDRPHGRLPAPRPGP